MRITSAVESLRNPLVNPVIISANGN